MPKLIALLSLLGTLNLAVAIQVKAETKKQALLDNSLKNYWRKNAPPLCGFEGKHIINFYVITYVNKTTCSGIFSLFLYFV